jgi:hypothetical protein
MSKKYYHKTGGYIINVVSEDKDTVKGAFLNPMTRKAKIATFDKKFLSETPVDTATSGINDGIISDDPIEAEAETEVTPKSTPQKEPKVKPTKKIIKGEKGINITDETQTFIAKGKTVKNENNKTTN